MQKTLAHLGAAAKLIIADVAQLDIPAVATGAAAVLAPIIAGLLGHNVSPEIIGADLLVAGGIATMLQKITSGKTAPVVNPPAPAPAKAKRSK